MGIAALNAVWADALADAEIDPSAARLYVFAGSPPDPSVNAASWYPPDVDLFRTAADPFSVGQLADANAPENRDRHRISVFAGVPLVVVEGRVRHELQHAVQYDAAGAPTWELRRLVEAGVMEAVPGIPGSAVIYNLIPSESNANAAACAFLVRRHSATIVDDLLVSAEAALVRAVDVVRGIERLGLQHLCFGAIFADAVRDLCVRYQIDFDGIVTAVDEGALGTWEQLLEDEAFSRLRQAVADSVPGRDEVVGLDIVARFEAWRPARDAVQLALAEAYARVGI